jgi:hypothetical protein
MTTETNNFWKTYLDNEEDDLKETRDFLKKAGVDIDKARNDFSELLKRKGEEIKQEEATIRMQKGKRMQEEFKRDLENSGMYSAGKEKPMNYAYNVQFRDGEGINDDEKKKTEEKDRGAMEILKEVRKKEAKK